MKSCVYCETGDGAVLYRVAETDIVKCPACGLVYADTSVENPGSLYDETYFSDGEYVDYLADRGLREKNARCLLRGIRPHVPSGSLLECGCAYGFFLDVARQYWKVRGVEICGQAAGYAREVLGLSAETGDVEGFLERTSETFDVACFWDVIEHLTHPGRVLRETHRILNEGGVVCLTTGDIGSPWARLRGRRWRLLHPPTHLCYFSEEWFRRCLPEMGFEVVSVRRPGCWRSIGQTVYEALPRSPGRHMLKLCETVRVSGLRYYLNLLDIILVVAKKSRR